jgi:hypothetical protein
MTKDEFSKVLNDFHTNNGLENKINSINFLNKVTRLSNDLCHKLINSLWGCSEINHFGDNIYNLLEVSADANPTIQLDPKLKTNSCTVYIIYPDEHAATFALHKIKEYIYYERNTN